MRIAIDGTALYEPFGGVEYALWHLLRALADVDADIDYTVFVPRDGPTRAATEQFGPRWRWQRLRFAGSQKLQRIQWQQAILPRWLRQGKFDLLHAPTYVAPLRAPVPVVLTVYDTIALDQPQFATTANRLHYGKMLPRSIARATEIIVPSAAVAEAVARHRPAGAAEPNVIPLGVEPAFFESPDAATRIDVATRCELPPQYILFVGNFEPKKNLGNVLLAASQLSHSIPLVLVGGGRAWGKKTPSANSALDRKSNPDIQHLGYVSRVDLPALYALSDCFVWPSLAEGFGLPVLEALAACTPVVTSAAVALPRLEDVALLCDPRDPVAIAAQVDRVLGDNQLADRLRRAGRDYARAFSWESAARRTLEVYRGAAGRSE